jgi:hypothetical protein
MGVDATEIDLLKNKWNELTVVIGNVPQAIAEAGEAIKNAAGSLGAMREHLQELQKQFDATAPHTERWQKLNSEIKILESNLRALKAQAESLEDVQFDITVPDSFKLPKSLTDAIDNAPNLKLQAEVVFATSGETSSINFQNAKIQSMREELNAALTDGDRARIDQELALEEGKLARMSGMGQQWLEQQRSLWAEQHQIAMIGINAIGAGYQTLWSEVIVGHRQAKDEGDAIWLAIKNTALNAIGAMLTAALEGYLIDSAAHAANETTKTAVSETNVIARVAGAVFEGVSKAAVWVAETAAFIVKEVAMTAVFLAQQAIRVAAAIVEIGATIARAVANAIASLGPLGLFAAAGLIAAGVAVVGAIRGAFGFDQGGRIRQGESGFFEGNRPEIIAPEKNFDALVNEKMPEIVRNLILTIAPVLRTQTPQFVVNIPELKAVSEIAKSFITPAGELRNFASNFRLPASEARLTPLASPLRSAERAAGRASGTGESYDFTRMEKQLADQNALIERLTAILQQKEFSPVFTNMRNDEAIVRDNLPKAQSVIAARMR